MTDRAALEALMRGPIQRTAWMADEPCPRCGDPIQRIQHGQEVLIALAVFFGSTRLIDSAFITAP